MAKGHRYLTVVLDLDSGAVVFVGEGKGADALLPFWKRLRPAGPRSRPWPPTCRRAYRRPSATNLPKAKTSSTASMSSSCSTTSSRSSARNCTARHDGPLKKVLKGTRWLLLKNPENLDEEREKKRLDEALALNKPLATAYYMKEDLRQIWDQPGKRPRLSSSTAGSAGPGPLESGCCSSSPKPCSAP